MSGDSPSSFSTLVRRKTFGLEASPCATRSRFLACEAFPLEDEGELGCFPFRELVDLAAFRSDLGRVQLLFGLACEIGAAAHRDRPGDRLGEARDDDQRAGGMRGRHAGDDPERHEQAVLCTEDELADAGKPSDPRGLAERVLPDVPCRLGASRCVLDLDCLLPRRGILTLVRHLGLAVAGRAGVAWCQVCQREALRLTCRSWRPTARASERPPCGLKKSATPSWASAR